MRESKIRLRVPSGYPGTEASSSDLDHRCGRKTFGRSERRCRSSSRSAIWRYSIWPLIASYAAATLSRSEWMTLPLLGTPSRERACAKGRPADRCASS